jgi:hypothetical protein
MATRTITIHQCDKCGREREDGETITIRAVVDRKADAAGDMDDVVGEMDLCSRCHANFTRILLDILDRDDREKIMKKFVGVQLRIV